MKSSNIFVSSALEFRKLTTITMLAMLLAVSVVLNFFSIQVTPSLKFGFGYLATALMGMLYGPVGAAITAGLVDIVQFLIKPTGPFFFGFTFDAMVTGLIYGCCLYRLRPTLPRLIIAKVLHNVVVNILLNTYWLTILLGKGYLVLLTPRILKNLALLPVEIAVLFAICYPLARTFKSHPGLLGK